MTKQKLWIGWGVFAASAVVAMLVDNKAAAYVFAAAGAICGWIAFFRED